MSAVQDSRVLHANADKKALSIEKELSLVKHQGKSFDETIAAVNKELSASREKCGTLQWCRNEALSKS